ncbi:hypothetical protein Tco_0466470 [Tanacetum coccineum]
MQDGLVAGIDHGKAKKGLVDVAAYNPSTKSNYVSTVNALRAVDFSLLAQLESQKDATIADIMGLLHLEGPAAETPNANQLQPSPEKLMLPIYRPEDQVPLFAENLVGEASTYGVPTTATTTALSTTFTQTSSVPLILVADYEVSGAEPPTKVPSPPKIVFEKDELKTTPEHATTN